MLSQTTAKHRWEVKTTAQGPGYEGQGARSGFFLTHFSKRGGSLYEEDPKERLEHYLVM